MKNNDLSLTFTDFHHKAKLNKKGYYILNVEHFNRGIKNLNIFKLSLFYTLSYYSYMKNSNKKEFLEPLYNTTEEAVQIYKKYDKENSLRISNISKSTHSKLSKISFEIEFFEYIATGRYLYIPKDLIINVKSVSELFVVSFLLNYKPQNKDWTLTNLKQHINHLVKKGEISGAFSDWSLRQYLKKYRAILEGQPNLHTQATAQEPEQQLKQETEAIEQEYFIPTDEELVAHAEARAEEEATETDEGVIHLNHADLSEQQLIELAYRLSEETEDELYHIA